MTILSSPSNSHRHRIRSLAMSTLATSPFIVACLYFLIRIGSNLGEDAQVLFFFFGIPLFVGCSFIACMLMYRILYQQLWPSEAYRIAGLLAPVISVPLEWLLIYVTAYSPLSDK